MIINPEKIINEGIISNINNIEEQKQQNGIDLTLKSISRLNEDGHNMLTKEVRGHTSRFNIDFTDDLVKLKPGHYDILFNEEINIPNGMCAKIETRSTLNRGGNFVTAGLYDAGYKGMMGVILHINIAVTLEKGVRLAQIVFNEAEKGEMYDGIYNEKRVV